MATEPRIGFTGSGKQIIAEVPRFDPTPTPRLTAEQRANIRMLIAREHRGTESEASALLRVIALTEHDRQRYRGVQTSSGVYLSELAERRLTNLRRYLNEIEENT